MFKEALEEFARLAVDDDELFDRMVGKAKKAREVIVAKVISFWE